MTNTNTSIIIAYITIQVTIAFFVSIVGAIHVKRCLNEPKTDITKSNDVTQSDEKSNINEEEIKLYESTTIDIAAKSDNYSSKKKKGFVKQWIKTVWKLRGVYGALAVHSFDVLTDILVISEWLNEENDDNDHIDPQVMAYSAIFVMISSKLISSVAIYIKERSIIRSIFQFLDLLIFSEIFETHRKVVSQVRSKNAKEKTMIESTLSFKYIRNFEAVFESIPESVLQMVYVMRTSNLQIIFVISICQSIISMTNSILNNDYTQMQDEKFKAYKQRLPPTSECFKHALSRLCEVTYRIGLLALFWTVCGGFAFCILLGIEFLIIIGRLGALSTEFKQIQFDGDTILLSVSSLIIVPTEHVYAYGKKPWYITLSYWCQVNSRQDDLFLIFVTFFNMCCCMICCSCVVGLCGILYSDDHVGEISFIPLTRICTSFIELVFVVIWAFYADGGERNEFLLDLDHGLSVFIVTCVCYMIYTQYIELFPDFELPFGVSVRSKWAYALANEMSELQKIKEPTLALPYKKQKGEKQYPISDEQSFWDEPCEYQDDIPLTAAVIALSQGHHHIVKWLEDKGAILHKDLDIENFVIPTEGLEGKFLHAFSGDLDGLIQIEYNCKEPKRTMMQVNQQEVVDMLAKLIEVHYNNDIRFTAHEIEEIVAKEQVDGTKLKKILFDEQDGTDNMAQFIDTFKIDELYSDKIYTIVQDEMQMRQYVIENKQTFWDEPFEYQDGKPLTATAIALYKGHEKIVKWLQDQGAISYRDDIIRWMRKKQKMIISVNRTFMQQRMKDVHVDIPNFIIPAEELTGKFAHAFSGDLDKLKKIEYDSDKSGETLRAEIKTKQDVVNIMIKAINDVIVTRVDVEKIVITKKFHGNKLKQLVNEMNSKLFMKTFESLQIDEEPWIKIHKDLIQEMHVKQYRISNAQSFWEEPYEYQAGKPLTAAVIALSRGHNHVVNWLEEIQENVDAIDHKQIDVKDFIIPIEKLKQTKGKFLHALLGDLDGLKQVQSKEANSAANNYARTVQSKDQFTWANGKYGKDEEYKTEEPSSGFISSKPRYFIIKNKQTFWDEPLEYQNGIPITAVVIALAKGNDKIVKWLQDQGAISHQDMDEVGFPLFEPERKLFGKFSYAYSGDLDQLKKVKIGHDQDFIGKFWDESAREDGKAITPAIFALSKENLDIVEWLYDKGAVEHLDVDVAQAKELLFGNNDSDDDTEDDEPGFRW
eukprot:263820_1